MKAIVQSAAEPPNDRRDAVWHLLRITQDGAYRSLIDRGAKPRVVAYVSTVTRWRRYLSFLLYCFLKDKSRPLPQALEQLLLLGIAELVLLKEPPHAVVNEVVNVARSMHLPTGLTNGLLRSIVRAHAALPVPGTGNPVRDLAIRWSHPTWLVRRYVKRFGTEEATQLLQRNNEAPAYSIRVNRMHMSTEELLHEFSAQEIRVSRSDFLEDYLHITSVGPLIRKGYMDRGVCSVHDESAGLVVELLDARPGEVILDTCVAPGGKVLAAACRMQGSGQLHAWDIHPNRLQKVEEMAQAQGLKNIHVRVADLLSPPEMQADRVLLDVPCTGTGVLSKRSDLRWRRSEVDLMDLIKLQQRFLDKVVDCVRPDGILVYSTCSIEPEENEIQVQSFLERHPDFTLEHAGDFLPAAMVTGAGYMATLPHRHGMDGAFAARLRKSK